MSLHAIVQGFCKLESISILPASNIFDFGVLSKVTIVLRYYAPSSY